MALTTVPSKEEMKRAFAKAKSPAQLTAKFKGLIYGKPKRGKTTFLGSFPKILVLDFDGRAGVLAKVKGFNGRVVRVASWEDVEMWYWILATQEHPFESVAWDTTTMAQEIALAEVLDEKVARSRSKGREKDPYKAEQDDYGRSARKLRTWIQRYKNLDMHVVFTAHEREDEAPSEEDGETEAVWMVPDLQGAVRGFLCGLVDTIGYAYRVSKDGKLSFRMAFDRPGTFASDGYGYLPRAIENPTFDKIMSYYRKGE